MDDFRTFVSCADVDLTASVIWRDSIAAQVPDQNSRMSCRKAAPPDVDTAFGLVLIRGAILDGSAGLTYATLQSFYEYLILIKTKELQRSGA